MNEAPPLTTDPSDRELRRLLDRRVSALDITVPPEMLIAQSAHARRRRHRTRLAVAVVVVVAGAAAFVGTQDTSRRVTTVAGPHRGTTSSVPAAVDPDSTHVVLPGWKTVYYYDDPAPTRSDQVEYQWTNGSSELQLDFSDASTYTSLAGDGSGTSPGPISLRGTSAELVRYGGGRYGLGWVEDGKAWSVDGRGFDRESSFLAAVASITRTTSGEWAASLPAGTVTPAQRPAAVDALLVGVPVPAGLDVPALRTADRTATPYYLASDVYGQIECAWIGQLSAGTNTTAATAALHSIDQWPGMAVLDSQGGFGSAMRTQAEDALAGRTSDVRSALGC